jgi:hypothetical protein
MEFIDLDRDGQKQELLVMYYLSPENREEAPAAYEVHVLRRVDERTLEDVGTLLNGKEAIRFHYQPEIGLLFATFYDPLFQPNRIEVFQWKQGRMEAVDTFVKAAGE